MTDITPSPTQTRPLDGCMTRPVVTGEATAIGLVHYFSADDTVMKTDDDTEAGVSGQLGIIVAGGKHTAAGTLVSGERASVVLKGPVYLGESADLDPTKIYYAGDAGVITDVAPSNVRPIGYALNDTVLYFDPSAITANS